MKKLTVIISTIVLSVNVSAQDFHNSQFEQSSLYLNPALTGQDITEDADWRAATLYRSQWGQISTKPFSSIYASYDARLKERWGIGGYIINNQAGAPTFRTFNFMVSTSYNVIDPKSDHKLTTGLQLGFFNKSFQVNNLFFDEQYSSTSGGFDNSLSNGENIGSSSIYRLDGAWGVYYQFLGKQLRPYIGFSLGHITLPNQTFIGETEPMPMIWKANFGSEIAFNDEFSLKPAFLYMYQKAASEFLLMTTTKYNFDDDFDLRLLLGIRVGDAAVTGIGMRYHGWHLNMTYDINISTLNTYTSGRGGFEISLAYQGAFANDKIKKMMGRM
ncbi:PorP/SprF family type IX secretion system membrane protein [Paracrocinitomix mangrovi]|uniref:PorP/SprF family type IX secretion system membrane protein n=1 Tax=Paracrocinitomix mangrovi TaxID=2862509 RepID=UPI001C8E1FD3|nr:PorP/SprF family type IX secretion system membrane protein [Paracrocinitomix mangrovi]UKN03204.1 PorP/SprF family type IX secretion system membrane protein [Paracrocinitomix mangrovi]